MFKRKKEDNVSTSITQVLSNEEISKKIDKNREEIHKWLSGDYPLNIVYMRVRMLSYQNERLISQLKSENGKI